MAQGAVATGQGIGAALSTTFAGMIVVAAGYTAAFLSLAAIAGAARSAQPVLAGSARPHVRSQPAE